MATFAHNFPEAAAIWGDIRHPLVKARILESARIAAVVIGGPPCQAFSQVRNHSRVIDDPRNALYREFVATLREALPPAFVMENVTGIDQMGVREQIKTDLGLDGEYAVSDQVVNAADFGVPQIRKRLLFVGVRKGSGMSAPVLRGSGASQAMALARLEFEGTAHYEVVGQQRLLDTTLERSLCDPSSTLAVTAQQALSDLAGLEIGRRLDSIPVGELPPPTSRYQETMRQGCEGTLRNVQVPRIQQDTLLRLQGIPPGGNYRDLPQRLLERFISGQRWGQDNGTGKLSRKHFYAYRRLHPSIWAWTLNTKADSVYHYEKTRALSVREFARLQSFPDRFVFSTDPRRGLIEGRHDGGGVHSRYRQVGNAVPPLLAKSVADSLLAELNARQAREEIRAQAG